MQEFFDERYYRRIIIEGINRMIVEEKAKEIVIYPFGKIGKLFKEILNNEFGIKEKFIIDEKLSKVDLNIRNIKDLKTMDVSKYTFVISSDLECIFEEIREQIKVYVPQENIFDLFDKVVIHRDTRVETLRLNAERINIYNVEGNVAELGVWKGEFAKYINEYFKERKLYLFDTFEGFMNERVKKDCDETWNNTIKAINEEFDNPDWEHMLDNFKYPEKCILKKGYFPDSAEDVEDIFAFVSLDVDVYAGTKAGLEWFWTRLSKGGIIMIHDYNCNNCPGVKKAVDEFAISMSVAPVCLNDRAGSVIFIK